MWNQKRKKKKRLSALLSIICTLIYADACTICYIEEGKSLLFSLLVPLLPFGGVGVCLIIALLISNWIMGDD